MSSDIVSDQQLLTKLQEERTAAPVVGDLDSRGRGGGRGARRTGPRLAPEGVRTSARKLKDLPGWDAATVEAAKRTRYDGSVYQSAIGDWLRVIGAFVAPPSVDHVTADLVKAFLVGLARQKALANIAERKESPDKVVNIRDIRARRKLRALDRQRLQGNWAEHWTNSSDTKVPGL